MKYIAILLVGMILLSAGCDRRARADQNGSEVSARQKKSQGEMSKASSRNPSGEVGGTVEKISFSGRKTRETPVPKKAKNPRTVREFFMLLPAKYFPIECCQNSKESYLRNYLTVEDTKNGYMEGGGDGAQSTFKMALFKRPDKTYIIGFNSYGEAGDDYYFLEYKNGGWNDISGTVVPRYSKKNIYEFPRYGTTIKVFAKKVIDTDGEFEMTEKGRKLYDLKWSAGKFSLQ